MSDDDTASSRRVSYRQLKILIDFMGEHSELAVCSDRTTEARYVSKNLWRELARNLNSCSMGSKKTMDQWSKYWSDYKSKLKNKVKQINKRRKAGVPIKALTNLEKRALIILRPSFERQIKNRKVKSDILYQKNESDIKNDFGMDISDDRLTDLEAADSDAGADSDYEPDDREDSDAVHDNTLHDVYPKWLIEVEKKRADAELSRAKAEQQRVAVAAKRAEAGLVQAEAFRKIAEAAAVQAEAVARIAAALQLRGK